MAQLLENAVLGTVVILVAALLRLVLKNKLPPEAWLALWVVCLLRLLTPAAPGSVLSVYALPVLPEAPAAGEPARAPPAADGPTPAPGGAPQYGPPAVTLPVPSDPIPTPSAPAPDEPPVEAEVNWAAVLGAVWLLGAAVTAVRQALSWQKTRRLVRGAVLVAADDPRYAALPKGVRLREGPVQGAPLTFGVVRPTVVLTPGLSGAALEYVLTHEGVHAQRRDNLWHYVTAAALAIHWWNPAVRLLAGLLRRDLELSCDRAVLRRLGADRRREYAETLLSLSTKAEGPPFCRAFGLKQVEERIVAIMKYKKTSICAIVLSLALVFLVTAAFAAAPVADPEPEENAAAPVTDPAPAADPAPEEISEETIVQALDIHEKILMEIVNKEFNPMSTAETTGNACPHLTREPWYGGTSVFSPRSPTAHLRIYYHNEKCTVCGDIIPVQDSTVSESHHFGSGEYTGQDHSAADPSKHYLSYNHTCTDCYATYSYTTPTGCTSAE